MMLYNPVWKEQPWLTVPWGKYEFGHFGDFAEFSEFDEGGVTTLYEFGHFAEFGEPERVEWRLYRNSVIAVSSPNSAKVEGISTFKNFYIKL